MVRLVVAEVQAAGDAKAERLRAAIREALAVIEAASTTLPTTSRWPAPPLRCPEQGNLHWIAWTARISAPRLLGT
jgi:hypothetical protein